MQIHAAFCDPTEIPFLIKHGASELYCGLLTNYENEGMTNHRHNVRSMNLPDLDSLKESVELTHRYNKKVNVVVNEVGYPEKFLRAIFNKMSVMDKIGIDGLIVSDIPIINYARKNLNAKLLLSSVAPVFNTESLDFYKSLDLKRWVLPQHLFPLEYSRIKEKVNIETEIFFFKTDYCRCIDGHCFYTYNSQLWNGKAPLNACYQVKKAEMCGNNKKSSFIDNKKSYLHFQIPIGMDFYGAVYDYYQLGIDFIKLGNREAPWKLKQKIILLTEYMLGLLKTKITRERFKIKSKLKALSLIC